LDGTAISQLYHPVWRWPGRHHPAHPDGTLAGDEFVGVMHLALVVSRLIALTVIKR